MQKVEYSKQDKEQLLDQWNKVINDFREDYNKWQKHTLKEYILKCAEIAAKRIEAKTLDIPLKGISSYLLEELNNSDIQVSRQWVTEILPEPYKRNYDESKHGLQIDSRKSKWETIINDTSQDLKVQTNQFGGYKINDQELIVKPKVKTNEEQVESLTEIINYLPGSYQKYFTDTIEVLKDLVNLQIKIVSKAQYSATNDPKKNKEKDAKAKLSADLIKKALDGAHEFDTLIKDRRALHKHLDNLLDDRNDVTKFEKLKAVLLDKIEYNTSKVAKLLNITPKHLSANIIRTEFPELHKNFRNWFSCIEIKTADGKTQVIDLGEWFDRQYNRGELGLKIQSPFLIKYKVE